MNWYKRSQLSNHPHRNVFPSDFDESYYLGEDDPWYVKEDSLQRRRRDYEGFGESAKRNERWKKIYPHQDEIKILEEQLKNLDIGEEERKSIRKRIGVHNAAIARIFSGVGKPIDVRF